MLTADRVSALLMLVVALTFGVQLRGLPELDALFPRWVLAVVVALSLGLLIRSWTRASSEKAFKIPNLRTLGPAVGLMLLWLILIPVVGFYVASVLTSTLLMAFVDSAARRLGTLMASFAIVAVEIGVFYVVFANLLDVPLPRGFLF